MAEDKLAEIRRMTKELLSEDVPEWHVNYAKLQGIADTLACEGQKKRSGNMIMAKKLCSYYMRHAGFTYRQIAKVIDVGTHATVLHHYNECAEYLQDGCYGVKDYQLAHKKAQELGIAV